MTSRNQRRLAGWAMAIAATATTVSAFALVGPFAVLYLAALFALVVFGTLGLIVTRQLCCRRPLDRSL